MNYRLPAARRVPRRAFHPCPRVPAAPGDPTRAAGVRSGSGSAGRDVGEAAIDEVASSSRSGGGGDLRTAFHRKRAIAEKQPARAQERCGDRAELGREPPIVGLVARPEVGVDSAAQPGPEAAAKLRQGLENVADDEIAVGRNGIRCAAGARSKT